MTFNSYANINRMLASAVGKSPDTAAYRWFDSDLNTQGVSWREFSSQAGQVSKGLLALGVKKDEKISILSNTC